MVVRHFVYYLCGCGFATRFIFYIILLCSHTKIDDDKIDHQEISTFTDEIVYVLHRTIQSQRVRAENKNITNIKFGLFVIHCIYISISLQNYAFSSCSRTQIN